MDSSELRPWIQKAAITCAVIGGLSLSGCSQKPFNEGGTQVAVSSSPETSPPVDPATASAPEQAATSAQPVQQPLSVKIKTCFEPLVSANEAQRRACAAIRGGKVLVVDFGPMGSGIDYDARAVAKLSDASLNRLTNGVVHQTSVVMAASETAQLSLRAVMGKNPDGTPCVVTNGNTEAGWMSTIVRQTMPEAVAYPLVDAIGGISCDDGSGFLTTGNSDISNIPSGNGDIYANSYDPEAKESITVQLAKTEIHERAHRTLGLGHAGTITKCLHAPKPDPSKPAPSDVSLDWYLKADCTYDEYGDKGNLMSGTPAPLDALKFTDSQVDYWQQSVDTPTVPHGKTLTSQSGQEATISPSGPESYVTIPFPSGVPVADKFEDKQFDKQGHLLTQNPLTEVELVATNLSDSGPVIPALEVVFTTGAKANQLRFAAADTIPLSPDGTTFHIGSVAYKATVVQGGNIQLLGINS